MALMPLMPLTSLLHARRATRPATGRDPSASSALLYALMHALMHALMQKPGGFVTMRAPDPDP